MNVSAKTIAQLEGVLDQVVARCTGADYDAMLSDIYFKVPADAGHLVVTDDDDTVLAQCDVEAWSHSLPADEHYRRVQRDLEQAIAHRKAQLETLGFIRPFSLVLADDACETLAELYLVDDDTVLLPGGLMEGLEEDLDTFLKQLMEQ